MNLTTNLCNQNSHDYRQVNLYRTIAIYQFVYKCSSIDAVLGRLVTEQIVGKNNDGGVSQR